MPAENILIYAHMRTGENLLKPAKATKIPEVLSLTCGFDPNAELRAYCSVINKVNATNRISFELAFPLVKY